MKVSRPEPLIDATATMRFRMTPRDMTYMEGLDAGMIGTMQKVALSIFTDMSNNGFSLREALAAIYLSGLQHGAEASRELSH